MYRKIIFCFLSTCILLALTMNISAQELNARIIYLTGKVEVRKSGETSWMKVKENMFLSDGDRIKTFENAKVEIALDKDAKNVVRVEENTDFILENARQNKTGLMNGKVLSVLEGLEPDSTFEIRTPTAVCGVAGSGIGVDTDGQTTNTGCYEHQAYVKGINKDGSFMPSKDLPEGKKCSVGRFQKPSDMKDLSEREKKNWDKFKEEVDEHKKDTNNGDRIVLERIEILGALDRKRREEQRDNRFEKREMEKREKKQEEYVSERYSVKSP